jgi:hypothetical protein
VFTVKKFNKNYLKVFSGCLTKIRNITANRGTARRSRNRRKNRYGPSNDRGGNEFSENFLAAIEDREIEKVFHYLFHSPVGGFHD